MCSSDLVLIFELEYEPEERASWDHPGAAAYAQVFKVMCRGIDVTEFVSDELKKIAEEEFLIDMEQGEPDETRN